MERLSARLGSADAASAELGITVESVPTIRDADALEGQPTLTLTLNANPNPNPTNLTLTRRSMS